tara:strand:- start:7948 stop:9021 length:1074 start_codon:yes stop_codon:yes gene_type:complete
MDNENADIIPIDSINGIKDFWMAILVALGFGISLLIVGSFVLDNIRSIEQRDSFAPYAATLNLIVLGVIGFAAIRVRRSWKNRQGIYGRLSFELMALAIEYLDEHGKPAEAADVDQELAWNYRALLLEYVADSEARQRAPALRQPDALAAQEILRELKNLEDAEQLPDEKGREKIRRVGARLFRSAASFQGRSGITWLNRGNEQLVKDGLADLGKQALAKFLEIIGSEVPLTFADVESCCLCSRTVFVSGIIRPSSFVSGDAGEQIRKFLSKLNFLIDGLESKSIAPSCSSEAAERLEFYITSMRRRHRVLELWFTPEGSDVTHRSAEVYFRTPDVILRIAALLDEECQRLKISYSM